MKKLRELRERKDKMTQSELGEEIGVADSTISYYEIGKREPDFETLKKIAAYFNVTIDYLLDYSKPFEGTTWEAIDIYYPSFGYIAVCAELLMMPQSQKYKDIHAELLETNPDLPRLYEIAKAFGFTPDEFQLLAVKSIKDTKGITPNTILAVKRLSILNDDGIDRIIEHIDDLIASGKYKKHLVNQAMEKGA